MILAYIDASAAALVAQLLISAVVGAYFYVKRGLGWFRNTVAQDWRGGIISWLVASSFANVALFRVWTELFGYPEWATFEMKTLPDSRLYAAAILDLVLITIVVWIIVRISSRPDAIGWLSSASLLFICVIPLNAARDVMGTEGYRMLRFGTVRAFGPTTAVLVIGALALGMLIMVVLFTRPLCRAVCVFLLVISPFTFVNVGRALWRIVNPRQQLEAGPETGVRRSKTGPSKTRVVWILFDEMDQRITFEDRPSGLSLPEFDRFRSGSLYASAMKEAGDNTIPAVPSMMTGRVITRFREQGASHLALTFEGNATEVDFGSTPSLFRQARDLGFSVGVAGWGLPYCRIFAGVLDRCWWCEWVRPDNSVRKPLVPASIDILRSLFETPNFSVFGQSLCMRQHTENYFSLTRHAIALAVDPSIDLAFLHLHGPHPPHVFNRRTRDFSLSNSPIRGYVDSLALTDETLGKVRNAMEAQGMWDTSNVLVTSDHHNRSSRVFDGKVDHRVIFMVKLAGQDRGTVFSQPSSAVLTKDLIIELLCGRIKDSNELSRWLSERSGDADVTSAARPLH
jgi:hypothetical protein